MTAVLTDVEALAAMGYELAAALELDDVPEFGSPTWLALDHDDPRRDTAAVLFAWHAWAAGRGLAAPLQPASAPVDQAMVDHVNWTFSELIERAIARGVDDELKAVAEALSEGADWSAIAQHSRYVDAMLRRREQLAAPRGNDHPGGPVAPWGPDTRRPAA